MCICSCGKTKIVLGGNLRAGYTLSCGCLQKENVHKSNSTHGKAYTFEYKVWKKMLYRCKKGKYWADKGITVCLQWLKSFEIFYLDMGTIPSDGRRYSLDRIDNNRGYEPGNCRWATYTVQARNKSNSILISYKDETLCLADWAEKLNIKYQTLYDRIFTYNWSIPKAFETKSKT